MKIVAPCHYHILDAHLDGCEVYFAVINSTKFIKADDFIANYCKDYIYLTVPKSLENCYCDANELHYNELVKSGKQTHLETSVHLVYAMYAGFPNSAFVYTIRSITNEKQIEYNTQLQNWIYCPKENEDDADNFTPIGNKSSDIGGDATMQKSTINNFLDFGYTADFEGYIYEKVENRYIGYVIHSNQNGRLVVAVCWNIVTGVCSQLDYNLTPIVKEVYPIFKKSLITDTIFRLDSDEEYVVVLSRLLGEIGAEYSPMSSLDDVPYDTERGLYHGQPSYYFKDSNVIMFRYEIGKHYDHEIKEVPLSTLKTLDKEIICKWLTSKGSKDIE